jgi:hypothetical protein
MQGGTLGMKFLMGIKEAAQLNLVLTTAGNLILMHPSQVLHLPWTGWNIIGWY